MLGSGYRFTAAAQPDQTARTATIERVADPQGVELEAIWEAEGEQHRLEVATERLSERSIQSSSSCLTAMWYAAGLLPRSPLRSG